MSVDTENVAVDVRRRRPDTGVTRALELGVLTAVPVALLVVYSLPVAVRQSLVFEYGDPTALTAAVAPFVHLELSHLLVNVASYAVVVPVAYALAVASDRRRQFWTGFVTFVVVFPPVLSLSNLAVPRSAYGLGFSGVVLAFVGSLPVGIAAHIEREFDVGPRAMVGPAAFFLGLALVAALSLRALVPANPVVVLGTLGLVVASLLCSVLYWLEVRTEGGRRSVTRVTGDGPRRVELVILAGVLFVGMPFVAFPADPTRSAGVLNLYVHLLGFVLGFTTTYARTCLEAGPSRETAVHGR